ncbi:MAG: hypothetical protein KMY50_00540 [Candidatus Desulforudis sp.]|nr:hypothetical protein [Desulforudis sp.]
MGAMERIMVNVWDDNSDIPVIKKAFRGRWLVGDMATEVDGYMGGIRWSVALTQGERIAIYSSNPHSFGKLEVYESLEDAEDDLPEDVYAAVASQIDENYVQELDI